jgi:predicted signal transduction protein with EAL and GGDEF domain
MFGFSKIIGLVIIFSLITILAGKTWFNMSSPNLFLYSYGILVTIIVFTTFIIAFHGYKDPYYLAIDDLKRLKSFGGGAGRE